MAIPPHNIHTIHPKGIPKATTHPLTHHTPSPRPPSKTREFLYSQWKKYRVKLLLIIIIILSWFIFRNAIVEYLKQFPIIYNTYSHVQFQIETKTLLGLFYYSFLSSLFFIFLPIELIFIFYSTLDYPTATVVSIVIAGNIFGLIFNYITGRIVGKGILKYFMKKKFDSFHRLVFRYGGLILFIGNIIVFPIEPASLVYGAAKYPFRKFFWYSLSGKIIKFVFLIYMKGYLITKFFS